MIPPHDERPPWVIGMEWATQVTTIAVEMALPGWPAIGSIRAREPRPYS